MDSEVKVEWLYDTHPAGHHYLTVVDRLAEQFRQSDAVIITGVWGLLDGLFPRFCRWHHKPVFVRTVGMLENYILNRNRTKKWIARKLYVDHNLSKSSGLLVSTLSEEAQIRRIGYDAPIHIIPNGVNLHQFILPNRIHARNRFCLEKNDFCLLYLGRIHPKKGLDLLIEALASLHKIHPNVRLLVAGSFATAAYEQTIRSLVSKHRLHDRVAFLGELNDDEKLYAYAAANLFVLPSHSEGFSNAILEAMACNLPVVITPGCNFPEVALEGAGLIIDASVSSLASAIHSLLSNQTNLGSMGMRGRQLIERRYDWRLLATQTHDLLLNHINN
jgi:glycosyltransferase involved in cell wall biosynthesis